MPNPEKVSIVDEIKEKLGSAKIAILTDFQGLNVAEMTELRKQFRGAGIDYKVYKNTLTQLAAEQLGIDGIDEYLIGTTALAFVKEDNFATPAKIVKDFSAKHQKFKVKAGILGNRVIASEDVLELTNLPPREVLVAMVLGGFQSPLTKLLSILQAPVRDFVWVLKNLKDKKQEGGSEEASAIPPESPSTPPDTESEQDSGESNSDQEANG